MTRIKYFKDSEFSTNTKCPFIKPDTMVGSIYCTTICHYFKFDDVKNKTITCCNSINPWSGK